MSYMLHDVPEIYNNNNINIQFYPTPNYPYIIMLIPYEMCTEAEQLVHNRLNFR